MIKDDESMYIYIYSISAHVLLYRKRRTEMSHGTPLSPETHPRCSMLPYLSILEQSRKERKYVENMEMLSSCSALGKEVRPTITNSARGIPVLQDPSIEAL